MLSSGQLGKIFYSDSLVNRWERGKEGSLGGNQSIRVVLSRKGWSKRTCWGGGIKTIEETVVVKEDGGRLDGRGTFLRFGTVERRGEGRR